MPTYTVLKPILRNGVYYFVGNSIALQESDAIALLGNGAIAPSVEQLTFVEPEGVTVIEPPAIAKINVNSCSKQELTDVDGIGPTMAANIIELRPIDDLAILSEIPRFRDEWLEVMEV